VLYADPPSTSLHGKIALSGFPANTSLLIAECATPIVNLMRGCSAAFLSPDSDANGAFQGNLAVNRSFTSISYEFVSCEAPGSCSVVAAVAAGSTDPNTFEQIPLSFRDVGPVEPPPPPPPPPAGSIRVTPNTDLSDLQRVTLAFTGNFGNDLSEIAQCKTGADLGPAGVPNTLSRRDCGPVTLWGLSDGGTLDFPVFHTVEPVEGPPFSCTGPGACSIVAKPRVAGQATATAPITFGDMPAPRSGAVNVSATSGPAGTAIQVSGTGWAAFASVAVGFCLAHVADPQCLAQTVPLDAAGNFSSSAYAQLLHYSGSEVVDCTRIPGACVVRVVDRRDPEHTAVDIPFTVLAPARPRGTATLDLNSPLVTGLTVRFAGAGWASNALIAGMLCEGSALTNCRTDPTMAGFPDSAGVLRMYPKLYSLLNVDCTSAPRLCSFAVFDTAAPSATVVWIPLTFARVDSVEVVSRYEPAYEALLQTGVFASCSSWVDLTCCR